MKTLSREITVSLNDLEKGGHLVRIHFLPKVIQSIIFIAFIMSSSVHTVDMAH